MLVEYDSNCHSERSEESEYIHVDVFRFFVTSYL